MKYVLPLSPDYVADWSDWHAVRELLQNAMDAHDAGGAKPTMRYSNGTLTIESPRERLPRKSLLLGGTTKADDKNQRGQFGEGYKLALLVFCRNAYDVMVENGGEVWVPNFERQPEFDNEQVLTIDIKSCDGDPFDGIRFMVKGISEDSWKLIESRWLPDIPHDSILPFESRGNIYSGGLFITQSKSLLRGYNFAPHRLNLGRDRDIVGDFDIKVHTACLWQHCKPNQVLDLTSLLKANAADVEYVTYVPSQSAAIIVKEYEREYGENTVPVKDQRELDAVRSAGFNGQIVSNAFRMIVGGVKKFIFHELRTPGGKMKQFFDKHESKLPLDAREELEILVKESAGWR